MTDINMEQLVARSNVLKVELKLWEREFAAGNDGKKASREDIKGNPEIVAKYKEYNKARDIISGKTSAPPPLRQTPRKRKNDEELGSAVLKRQQLTKTPSKTPSKTPTKDTLRPWELDPYDSPSVVRSLFTPSKKSLGPTPQKEGLVLGLFDLLEPGSETKSEEKNSGKLKPIAATPRKSKTDAHGLKHTRTPGSRSKQKMLDAFSTPSKNRDGQGKTPSSVSKLVFSTPSFLRRAPLPVLNEDDHGPISPQMVRVPRKPLVRGLSSILAGLKQMEEDAADEDLDALHEMEMMEREAESGIAAEPIVKLKPKALMPPEDILVEDSQPGILGGFDDIAELDSDAEDAGTNLGRDGQPLKVYKKKGQKRTTRRTNMKPSRAKPSASKPSTAHPDSEDELSQGVVPETQQTSDHPEEEQEQDDETAEFTAARNFDSDTQSEYTASEGGTRYRRPNQEKKKSKSANKDGRVKTAARKVTALAGQNFKRLKLRNSGAKGGPGHGSRFRRKK